MIKIDIKVLKKILVKWIQQHIKRLMHHNQLEFISSIQGCLNICKSINVIHSINRMKKKMVISSDAEKSLDKIQHFFVIKPLNKLGMKGNWSNIINIIYEKPNNNIRVNSDRPKAFPLRSRIRHGYSFLPLPCKKNLWRGWTLKTLC